MKTMAALFAIITIHLAALAYCYGEYQGEVNVVQRPVYVTQEKEVPVYIYQERIVEKPVYVDRPVPVEVPVYADRVVEHNYVQLIVQKQAITERDFRSLDEFVSWANCHIPRIWTLDHDETCTDAALALQAVGLREGYSISIALSVDGYMHSGLKVSNIMGKHMANLVAIPEENGLWYFDTSTGKITDLKRIAPLWAR